jgi:hypothetical protein
MRYLNTFEYSTLEDLYVKVISEGCNDIIFVGGISDLEKNNIKWLILEENIKSIDKLNNRETYWIEEKNTFIDNGKGYNLKSCGDNRLLSEKTKLKISKSHMGNKNPMYGKNFSDTHRKRLSESRKGKNNPMYGISLIPWNKGKIYSKEWKQKQSEIMKQYYKNIKMKS